MRVTTAAVCALFLGLSVRGASASDAPCQRLERPESSYIVCTADLRRHEVRLFWRGPDGEVLGSFERLRQTADGARLAFAMNAGMYHEDRSPVGLYVENGRELKKANTASGPGNFHLKPNGVFYVKDKTAGVLETRAYLNRRLKPDFATQSGPMLVVNGRIHPKISDQGTSQKIRNGVGIKDQHTAVFAISEQPVTFGAFARLFRDQLGCANALFLDGSISSLYAPALGRADALRPMGPIVGAFSRR